MTNICCGPTFRPDGSTYLCQTCRKDVTEQYRSEGYAGQVIRWIGEEKTVFTPTNNHLDAEHY